MSTLLSMIIAELFQITSKQSSLRSAAFEAVRSIVEQQYKIEDVNGWKASVEEIQAIVARELDGEPLQWTIGTTYTNREASMATFSTIHDLLRDISVLPWHLSAPLHPCDYCENMLHQEWPLRWVISKILLDIRPNPTATHCICSYVGMSPYPLHIQAF